MDLFLLIVSVGLGAYAVSTTTNIRRARADILATAGSGRLRLGHYDLAYLVGGPQRVADTAIALLAGSGDLRMSRGGRVHKVTKGTITREPVEAAVLGAVAVRSGLPVMSLRIEVTRSFAVQAIKQRLTDEGLLFEDGSFARVRRLCFRLRMTSVAAYAGAGLEALTVLVDPAFLAVLALLVFAGTGIAAEVVLAGHRRRLRDGLTASGHEAIERARRENAEGVAEGPVPIALYGPRSVQDPALRTELRKREPRRERRPRAAASYAGNGTLVSYSHTSGYGSGASGCGGGGGGGGCGGGGCGGGC
ncbi:TIGR04222 domain-containing membrane protein [Nonomuraea sp. NPDC048882]|uniref:TIGR04222 domain-containing membrane protein n=1 Tax=Nonomuraea sp. NPDC048882 TaxID=3154347 RepID=UPI0033C60F49